jgi:dTDP-4-dehydrorhamnose reductase
MVSRRPRIVVIGGAGMLGHKLFQILRERFPGALATTLEDVRKPPLDRVEFLQGGDVITGLDVTDFGGLGRSLADMKPDFIINCVGIIKQRLEATSPIPSITINSLLPHKLAVIATEWGGRVIHFSTDCVFSGKRGAYVETDQSDAEDFYGRTKFLGEVAGENALTLRTSIIGRELVEHRSLLDWFLAQNHKSVRGYRRTVYSGITTNEMAEVVTLIIRDYPALSGLYQIASEPISKYDLLCMLRDAYKLDVEIVSDNSEVSDRSMRGDKFRAATGYVAPPWPSMVRKLADDPTPYERWLSR